MNKEGVKYWHKELSNVSEKAWIGDGSVIHAGVHIHDDVKIGKRCQVEAQVFIPNGVTIEDDVFIGPHVVFTNDPTLRGNRENWQPTKTLVKKGARIGANSSILAGVTIGEGAIVGMGSVVLIDVAPRTLYAGNPAKFIKNLN